MRSGRRDKTGSAPMRWAPFAFFGASGLTLAQGRTATGTLRRARTTRLEIGPPDGTGKTRWPNPARSSAPCARNEAATAQGFHALHDAALADGRAVDYRHKENGSRLAIADVQNQCNDFAIGIHVSRLRSDAAPPVRRFRRDESNVCVHV